MTNLIVDVCNVHHKMNIELEVVSHNAPNNIRSHIVARMAQMRIVVNSRAARIPGHFLSFRIKWNKGGLRFSQRVPHLQRWELSSLRRGRLPPRRLLARRHEPERGKRHADRNRDSRYREEALPEESERTRGGEEGHGDQARGAGMTGTTRSTHSTPTTALIGPCARGRRGAPQP